MQINLHGMKRAKFLVLFKNKADDLHLIVRHQTGVAFFDAQFLILHDPFAGKTKGRLSAQPASGIGKHQHIILNALRDRFPFQLGENGGDLHHGASHGGSGIKTFVDTDKADPAALQLFGNGHKINNITADSVQTVHYDLLELFFLRILHHAQELRAFCILTAEALVFIDQKLVFFTGVVGVDVAFAHFDLIADTLAFICRFAFAAINGEFHTSTSEVIVTLRSGAGNKTDFFCLYSSPAGFIRAALRISALHFRG